jgi:hypothetical protein
MNDANLIANEAKNIVQAHLDRLGEPKDNSLSPEVKQEKFARSQQSSKYEMLYLWRTITVILMCKSLQNLRVVVFLTH